MVKLPEGCSIVFSKIYLALSAALDLNFAMLIRLFQGKAITKLITGAGTAGMSQ